MSGAPPWTAHEIALAAEIWRHNIVDMYGEDRRCDGAKMRAFELIGRKIHRSAIAVQSRLSSHGPSFSMFSRCNINGSGTSMLRVPGTVLAEREALRVGREQRDLTATLCGDPPVGFSALERKQGVVHSRPNAPTLSAVNIARNYDAERYHDA